MDWGRAKTILIVSFLCLNLFLGYQLWEEQRSQGIEGQISQLQIAELQQKLRDANITYAENSISDDMPEMSNMKVHVPALNEQSFDAQVERIQWVDQRLEVEFKQPIPIPSEEEDVSRDVVFKSMIPLFDHYQYDASVSTEQVIVYTQRVNHYPVFTSQLHLHTDGQNWTGYTQSYYSEEEKGVSRQVVSAYTTLAVLLEHGVLHPGEQIYQVQLGYTIDQLDANVQFLVPAWRVIHTSGIHYINGFTGMVIGATTY